MERIDLIVIKYKKFSKRATDIELNVRFNYKPKKNSEKKKDFGSTPSVIYMDSTTKRGHILNNFRLGMLITILYYKKLVSFRYHQIEKQV